MGLVVKGETLVKINRLVVVLSCVIFSGSVGAGAMGSGVKMDDWWLSDDVCPVAETPSMRYPWEHVITASMGPVYTHNNGQSQTFYLRPEIIKTYEATPTSNTLFYGEFFLGMQKQLTPLFINLNGNIWDDADSAFDNYSYSYKIQHTHVAVKGKLLADPGYWFIPWVSASLGVGFNNSHAYENTPLIFEAITMPNFASYTKSSFTYTLGVGIQKTLNSYWQVGIGYEFANWGQSQLNPASGQTLNSGLSLSHLYTNGILFNLTYFL